MNPLVKKGYMIPGMMWPAEMHWLASIYPAYNEKHLEIGAFCGKSLWARACSLNPSSSIYIIDNFSEETHIPSSGWAIDCLHSTMRVIHKLFDHTYSLNNYQPILNEIDSILIDADHSQEMVARDILKWWCTLREDGIMIGHDYTDEFPGVKNAVNDIFHDSFTLIQNTRFWAVGKTLKTDSLVKDYMENQA